MLTLAKAIDLFLAEHIPTTRRTYNYSLKPFQAYVGPARPLDKIRPEDLLEYMQSVRERPTIKSPASINKHIKTLRTFFNWAVKLGLIEVSPARGIRYRRRNDAVARQKAMPDWRYDQLVEYTRALEQVKGQARPYALVLFLGDTGCRIGGAAGLRWLDVDFDHRSATVQEKGKDPRPVFFGQECTRALLRWRGQQSMREGDYVFSEHGRRMKNDNLGQYFRRLCVDAGIGSWGPHSLRHRKAFQFVDNRVSDALGAHALGDTIEVYLKNYAPKDYDRVKAALEEFAYQINQANQTGTGKIRKIQS